MYERYFQLRERPFALSPDPEYLYPSRVHQEALSYLRYGVEGHAGFVVITGEIGSGKTTLLQSLLTRLDRNTTVARIVNTMLDPRELLEAILFDFGMDPTGLSKPALLHRLGQFLVQQRQAGRLSLLVIDEAQNLNLPALEEIRMLSNFETEKSKLLQIVLIGQPELRDKLGLPQLEQLRQRITVSYHLQPLDAIDTHNYINHRLKRAAIGAPLEFPPDATEVIHARSRGVPRIINVIADAALLFAYGVDRRGVDVQIVNEALEELDATGVLASYHAESGYVESSAARSYAAESAPSMDSTAIEEARRREEALRRREQQLAMREQALAAQQKVIEEEARLLAAARTASLSAVGAPATPGAGAPATAAAATAAARTSTTGVAEASNGPAPVAHAERTAASPRVASGAPAAKVAGAAGASGGAGAVNAYIAPSGVRVQRYAPVAYPRPRARYGMWERLRRVLFGVAEPS